MAGILDFEILEDGKNFKIPLKIISKTRVSKFQQFLCVKPLLS